VFAALAALTLQFAYSVSQTDPLATDWNIISTSEVLVLASVILLVNTYLAMKHQDCVAAAVGLFLTGSAGFALAIRFADTIVHAFYPKTYILAFLYVDLVAVALAGICLPAIVVMLKLFKPVSTGPSQQ